MVSVSQFLSEHGPSRSSLIVEAIVAAGSSPEAARQKVSRAAEPVKKFPVPMLPKREAFLYLAKDRNGERFWQNFVRDMRASGSVYAAAIDGMIARGGLVRVDQFATISGAPIIPQKGQVFYERVAQRLIDAGFMKIIKTETDGLCYELAYSLANATPEGMRARDLTERVILDGVREWSRNNGFASYNAVRVRGDADLQPIGPFKFDLAGPSYLLPLQGASSKPGFLVADVFAEGRLTVHEIQYFVRKARMLKATLKDTRVLPLLIAEGFTGEAITAGHAAGISLTTPRNLFGKRVAAAIVSLCETLKNAAAYASSSPERLSFLLDSLFDIEGRSLNLRGILFELVAAYLARRDAVSIDMNVKAKDPKTGKTAEIDVQKVTNQSASVTAIECKGKEPGGVLTLDEIETWLGKIHTMREFYRHHSTFRESQHRFEIWTSGTIAPDALALLVEEKAKRLKAPIDWKDGEAVLTLAQAGKEKGIADSLYQHFLAHPYEEAAKQLEADKAAGLVLPSFVASMPATTVTTPALPAPAYDFVANILKAAE